MFSLVLKIKRSKIDHRKIHRPSRSEFSSPRPFQRWSWNYCSPSGLLENWWFVGLYWRLNPAVWLWWNFAHCACHANNDKGCLWKDQSLNFLRRNQYHLDYSQTSCTHSKLFIFDKHLVCCRSSLFSRIQIVMHSRFHQKDEQMQKILEMLI